MTATPKDAIRIEAVGGHDYLVSIRRNADTADFQLHADLRALGVPPERAGDEASVREAVTVLAERQPVADLPAIVDLADIAELFPGFREELNRRLGRR